MDLNQERRKQKKCKREGASEGDHSLMRGRDGDENDNGDNGSLSGPDGQRASTSLALETPSARGENASK